MYGCVMEGCLRTLRDDIEHRRAINKDYTVFDICSAARVLSTILALHHAGVFKLGISVSSLCVSSETEPVNLLLYADCFNWHIRPRENESGSANDEDSLIVTRATGLPDHCFNGSKSDHLCGFHSPTFGSAHVESGKGSCCVRVFRSLCRFSRFGSSPAADDAFGT